MTTKTTNKRMTRESIQLTAAEVAAISCAGKDWEKRRDEMFSGETESVDFCVRIKGMISIGAESEALGPADTMGVLAWVLDHMPQTKLRALRKAIEAGEIEEVGDDLRQMAKDLCVPTQKTCHRRGSLKGIVEVSKIELD